MLVKLMLALALQGAQADTDCFVVDKEIEGTSLNGLIKPGQEIQIYSPDCVQPARYDYIVFRTRVSDHLVIKQVWGLPGDSLEVRDDGSMYINGVKALTPYDRPYILMGLDRRKMKAHEGPLTGFLALGHPGSIDSGKLGLIDAADIVGVVKREEGRARNLGGDDPSP